MTMYVKYIYPKIEVGHSHARPSLPDCCTKIYETTLTWDIYSADDTDRVEYWEVDETKYDLSISPPLETAAEVDVAIYGPGGKAQYIIDNPPQDPTAP